MSAYDEMLRRARRKESRTTTLVYLALLLAILLPSAAYQAWIGQFLWLWFIEPVTGASVPSLWILAGFLMSVRYPLAHLKKSTDPDISSAERFGEALGMAFLYPSIIFVAGWVVHLLA